MHLPGLSLYVFPCGTASTSIEGSIGVLEGIGALAKMLDIGTGIDASLSETHQNV